MPGSSSANDEWIRHDFCAGGLVGLNWRKTRRVSVHGPWVEEVQKWGTVEDLWYADDGRIKLCIIRINEPCTEVAMELNGKRCFRRN